MAACGGLHCAGCGAGGGAPVLAFGAAYGFVWVTEHIVEVAITSAVCAVLAVAAVVWLMRLGERRGARQRAAASIWTVRPDALPPRRQAEVGQAAEQAQVIRQALNGRTDQS